MNAQEARRILKGPDNEARDCVEATHRAAEARGYLAALKGPEVKALLEGLKKYGRHSLNCYKSGAECVCELGKIIAQAAVRP